MGGCVFIRHACGLCVPYRVDDSPEGLEASPYRKHVFQGVCNSCELEKYTASEKLDIFVVVFVNVSAVVSSCGSYLGLVEIFDPYAVNNGSHRPGPLCLQEKNK